MAAISTVNPLEAYHLALAAGSDDGSGVGDAAAAGPISIARAMSNADLVALSEKMRVTLDADGATTRRMYGLRRHRQAFTGAVGAMWLHRWLGARVREASAAEAAVVPERSELQSATLLVARRLMETHAFYCVTPPDEETAAVVDESPFHARALGAGGALFEGKRLYRFIADDSSAATVSAVAASVGSPHALVRSANGVGGQRARASFAGSVHDLEATQAPELGESLLGAMGRRFEGYLHKRGAKRAGVDQSWSRRWCVLSGNYFVWFQDESEEVVCGAIEFKSLHQPSLEGAVEPAEHLMSMAAHLAGEPSGDSGGAEGADAGGRSPSKSQSRLSVQILRGAAGQAASALSPERRRSSRVGNDAEPAQRREATSMGLSRRSIARYNWIGVEAASAKAERRWRKKYVWRIVSTHRHYMFQSDDAACRAEWVQAIRARAHSAGCAPVAARLSVDPRLRRALAESGIAPPLPEGTVTGASTFALEAYQYNVDPADACLGPLGLAVGKTLGEGNFGKVALCTCTSEFAPRYSADVAVKVVTKPPLPEGGGGYASDKGAARLVKVLQGEIVALEHLQRHGGGHSAIIALFDVVESPTSVYLMIELAQGRELGVLVAERPLDDLAARIVARAFVGAVRFMHGRCVAHRDLKPENIIVGWNAEAGRAVAHGAGKDGEGRPLSAAAREALLRDGLTLKLLDFGFASVLASAETRMTTYVGTEYACAPEIWHKTPYTMNDCDAWGVGVVLYIALIGKKPFSEAGGLFEMKRRVKAGVFKRGAKEPLWDALSEGARAVTEALLDIDAARRMTLAAALQHPWLYVDPPALPAKPARTPRRASSSGPPLPQRPNSARGAAMGAGSSPSVPLRPRRGGRKASPEAVAAVQVAARDRWGADVAINTGHISCLFDTSDDVDDEDDAEGGGIGGGGGNGGALGAVAEGEEEDEPQSPLRATPGAALITESEERAMAAGAPPLPDGWAVHYDGESDSVYYIHRCVLQCSVAVPHSQHLRAGALRYFFLTASLLRALSLLRPLSVQRVASDGVGSARRRRRSC